MRNSILRAYGLGIITGGFITAAVISFAPPAKADAAYSYAAQYGAAVCTTLDEYPTIDGVLGVGSAIIKDGLTAYDAGRAIFYAVADVCPRHLGLLRAFAATGAAVTA